MSVPETLALELRRQRDLGAAFDAAWDEAVAIALRGNCDSDDWITVINATRGAWQAGYTRQKTDRKHRALLALSHGENGALEHEDLDKRACAWCGEPIPKDKKRSAIFCSYEHQRAAKGTLAA